MSRKLTRGNSGSAAPSFRQPNSLPGPVPVQRAGRANTLLRIRQLSTGVVQQMLSAERRYARCMRSHEVPNWPDPTTISRGVPGFVISVSKDGINPRSAQIRPTDQECERLTGSPAPRDVSP
jgi:hypothetical protein